MKNIKNYFFVLTLIAGATLLSSCLKNKDDDSINQPISALTVVNAYSGSLATDLYLDNQGIVSIDYKGATQNYFNIYPGSRRIRVNKSGTGTILADNLFTFAEGKYFSLFIANKTDANTDSAVFVITQDSVQTTSGKASIRFVNLSPGTRNFDVAVKGSTTPLFTNRAFKSASNFISIDPSAGLVLEVREAGTTNVKYEIPSVPIVAGRIYTVYTSGLWDGTGASVLTANIMRN